MHHQQRDFGFEISFKRLTISLICTLITVAVSLSDLSLAFRTGAVTLSDSASDIWIILKVVTDLEYWA